MKLFAVAALILGSFFAVLMHVSPADAAPVHVAAVAAHVRALPACQTDEGPDGQLNRGCVWDAHAEGNSMGRSFVIRRDAGAAHGRIVFVSHKRAHALLFANDVP